MESIETMIDRLVNCYLVKHSMRALEEETCYKKILLCSLIQSYFLKHILLVSLPYHLGLEMISHDLSCIGTDFTKCAEYDTNE
jgi:hypothetical protein